jgi:hypothetical protein
MMCGGSVSFSGLFGLAESKREEKKLAVAASQPLQLFFAGQFLARF